jgi:hypothetical protein
VLRFLIFSLISLFIFKPFCYADTFKYRFNPQIWRGMDFYATELSTFTVSSQFITTLSTASVTFIGTSQELTEDTNFTYTDATDTLTISTITAPSGTGSVTIGLGSDDGDDFIIDNALTGIKYSGDDEAATIGGGSNKHTINGSVEKSLWEFHTDGNTAPGGTVYHRHSNTPGLSSDATWLKSAGDHDNQTIVADGEQLGHIRAAGYDGTDYALAAEIAIFVDTTPGNDDMGGRICLKTSLDGTQTPIDNLCLNNAGVLTGNPSNTATADLDWQSDIGANILYVDVSALTGGGGVGIGTSSIDNKLDIAGGNLDLNTNNLVAAANIETDTITSRQSDLVVNEGSSSCTTYRDNIDIVNGIGTDVGDVWKVVSNSIDQLLVDGNTGLTTAQDLKTLNAHGLIVPNSNTYFATLAGFPTTGPYINITGTNFEWHVGGSVLMTLNAVAGQGDLTTNRNIIIGVGASDAYSLKIDGSTTDWQANHLGALDILQLQDDIAMLNQERIYFDSIDTYIAANTDNPEDLIITADQDIHITPDNETTIGDGGISNFSAFESDGTLEFNGTATVWDDLRVPGLQVKIGASAPDLTAFLGAGNLLIYRFDGNATTEQVYFTIQLPHSYKEGSDITPHVHWSPINANAGNVKWQLEYSWANIDATFPAVTTITATDAASGTAWDHQTIDFSAITGTGKTISSMLVCRLFRDPTDAADTYASDAALLEIDFHFEINTIGSRAILTK